MRNALSTDVRTPAPGADAVAGPGAHRPARGPSLQQGAVSAAHTRERRTVARRDALLAGVGLLLLIALALAPSRAGADPGGTADQAMPTGEVRIVTALVTRVSSSGGTVGLELYPRTVEISAGDRVLWLNAVPGAVASVVFETEVPAVEDCATSSRIRPIASRAYVSKLIAPGTAEGLCFLAPGTFAYRLMLSGAEGGIALEGRLVVR